MKTHTLTYFLAALLIAANAFALDYDGALKAAKKDNKPVLLYFFSKDCSYCRMMDKETLADKEIDGVLKNEFVFHRVDVDRSVEIARLYGVNGYPVSWFLDASGKRIFEAPGFIQKSIFGRVLEFVKGGYYKKMDLHEFIDKRKSGKL